VVPQKRRRGVPLHWVASQRKGRLPGVKTGIALNEHIDAMGELVFRHACAMGLEGIVSKRFSATYRSGPSRNWRTARL
jgi:ATP-dependent DNA ligase